MLHIDPFIEASQTLMLVYIIYYALVFFGFFKVYLYAKQIIGPKRKKQKLL